MSHKFYGGLKTFAHHTKKETETRESEAWHIYWIIDDFTKFLFQNLTIYSKTLLQQTLSSSSYMVDLLC